MIYPFIIIFILCISVGLWLNIIPYADITHFLGIQNRHTQESQEEKEIGTLLRDNQLDTEYLDLVLLSKSPLKTAQALVVLKNSNKLKENRDGQLQNTAHVDTVLNHDHPFIVAELICKTNFDATTLTSLISGTYGTESDFFKAIDKARASILLRESGLENHEEAKKVLAHDKPEDAAQALSLLNKINQLDCADYILSHAHPLNAARAIDLLCQKNREDQFLNIFTCLESEDPLSTASIILDLEKNGLQNWQSDVLNHPDQHSALQAILLMKAYDLINGDIESSQRRNPPSLPQIVLLCLNPHKAAQALVKLDENDFDIKGNRYPKDIRDVLYNDNPIQAAEDFIEAQNAQTPNARSERIRRKHNSQS